MKAALLQLNPTVGALDANAEKIILAARRAADAGATLAVTPELAVTGYPPRDLLEREVFLRDAQAATARVLRESPRDLVLVLGTVDRDGPRLYNAALAVRGGKVLARTSKQLLPTYDVFDEARYFTSGTETAVLDVDGVRVAITICEDAWFDSDTLRGRYQSDPMTRVRSDTADLALNLAASPFTLPKLADRARLFSALAKRTGVRTALVNQVGGNDELLFDGRSTIWSKDGEVEARGRAFEEDIVIAELGSRGPIAMEPTSDEEAAYAALVLGVRDYTRKCGFERAVIGLSGGIDSALVATIACDALGADHVRGVAMPTRFSSEGSRHDAEKLARNLGCAFDVVEIDTIYQAYLDGLGLILAEGDREREGDVTLENVQARIRGATLMALSNRTGALVLTTGNKSEIAVGYCTLYGDMVGGLAVVSDVPKTMVYRIARWVNRDRERIPEESIEKPPSAELRPNQKDSDSLPPYELLDPILELYVEAGLGRDAIIERGHDRRLVEQALGLVRRSEYKRRQMAPGLIITRKAFGVGRRYPIAQGYGE